MTQPIIDQDHPPGYRAGLITPVSALTKRGDANAVGDLVAQEGNYLKTYAQMDAMPGPTLFFDRFLGVLVDGAAAGQEGADTPAVVYAGGQYAYALSAPAAKYYPCGTFVTAFADRVVKIDESANAATCIGKLAEPCAAGDTAV